jgi:hypothetical protein
VIVGQGQTAAPYAMAKVIYLALGAPAASAAGREAIDLASRAGVDAEVGRPLRSRGSPEPRSSMKLPIS